jgi:hypothetical protein
MTVCLATTAVATAATDAPVRPPASVAGSSDSQEDIRDIRGPKTPRPAWLLPALLSVAVLSGLAMYGVWRWRRRGRIPRALLPFEVALLRLEQIRSLMVPARAREFGIAVSDIVRNYIELRFNVIATQRTTEEFLQDLLDSSDASLARHRPLLSEFLQQCDFVKFAGVSVAVSSMESLRQSACAFVRETAEPEVVNDTNHREAHDSLPAA